MPMTEKDYKDSDKEFQEYWNSGMARVFYVLIAISSPRPNASKSSDWLCDYLFQIGATINPDYGGSD